MQRTPLNWEASAQPIHPQVSISLPAEVETCLENARFLHLATCDNNQPHIALMNYTYLPSTPFRSQPVIIMTTNPSSKKTLNVINNPRVSLLAHDWVSHRSRTGSMNRDGSPTPEVSRSSLATLLMNINTSAMSSISAQINGEARILEVGSEEEKWCKQQHLENHNYSEAGDDWGSALARSPSAGAVPAGGAGAPTDLAEDVRVVLVQIRDGRISDYKGSVKDWRLSTEGGEQAQAHPELVNGIR